MMAFLVTMPISIRMPITTGMLIGCPVTSSARITPPRHSGRLSRMVIGWNTLPNSSTSTASTIVSPAPIARAKPANTSPMISASPPDCTRTPGGRDFASGRLVDCWIAAPSASPRARSAPSTTRRTRS